MDLSSQKVVLAFAAFSLRAFLSAIQKEEDSNKKRPAEYQPDVFSLVISAARRSRGRARRASPRRSAGRRTPPRQTEEQVVDGLRAFGTGFLFLQRKTGRNADALLYQRAALLAVVLGFSSGHCARLFRKSFGVTFVDYITSYRIERAKELLLQSHLSIEQIAYRGNACVYSR